MVFVFKFSWKKVFHQFKRNYDGEKNDYFSISGSLGVVFYGLYFSISGSLGDVQLKECMKKLRTYYMLYIDIRELGSCKYTVLYRITFITVFIIV